MLKEKFQTYRILPEILPKAQYPLKRVKEILKSLKTVDLQATKYTIQINQWGRLLGQALSLIATKWTAPSLKWVPTCCVEIMIS